MTSINYKATLPAHVVDGWQKAQMGPLPTAEQLSVAHALSQRFGLEAFAGIACMLRDAGVSVKQQRIISALWSNGRSTGSHVNKVKALIADGTFEGGNQGGAWCIKLTSKGNGRLKAFAPGDTVFDRVAERVAEARKAIKGKLAKGKAKAAKVAKATPVSEPVEPVTDDSECSPAGPIS